MTPDSCTPAARALLLELVERHTPRVVQALMEEQLPGEVPSFSVIRNARAAYTLSRSCRFTRPLPRAPREAPKFTPIKQPPRAPLTFEEKLARVAAGASLIAVRPLRKPAPDFTLGGVASASL